MMKNEGGRMKLVGEIVRLQVQLESLKRGERPYQIYSTDNLQTVPALKLTAKGVVGLHGGLEQLDVHHTDHPRSRSRGDNRISVGFTSHYGRMRRRFGDHMTVGCAGENIIVETAVSFALGQLTNGIFIQTADGQQIHLDQVAVMLPCLPFSKFSLQTADPPAGLLKETLQFLDFGMRGFSAVLVGKTAVVSPGDKFFLAD
jgi:hypothetical protein